MNRDLSHSTITASSQVMLVVYPLFSAAVGLTYLLGAANHFAAPQLDPARSVMSLSHWGWMFLGLTVVKVVAFVLRSRNLMIVTLAAGFSCYLCWALANLIGCQPRVVSGWAHLPTLEFAPGTSLNAVWLWAFVAAAHIASLRSITRDSVGIA